MFNALQAIQAGQAGAEKKRRDDRQNALSLAGEALQSQDYSGAANALLPHDLNAGMQVMQIGEQRQQMQTQQAQAEARQQLEGAMALNDNLLTLPEAQRGEFLSQNWDKFAPYFDNQDFLTFWQRSGGDVSDATLQQEGAVLRTQLGMGAPEVETPDPFTLSQGQTRFDGQGNPIASVEPKPTAPNLKTVTTDEGIFQYDPANPRETMEFLGNRPQRDPLVTVSQKGEDAFSSARGKSASDRMDAIIEAGDAASQTLADAQMMNTLIDQIDYTGFGSEALLNIQKVGRMVGLDIGDDVPAKEAATRLTAKLGLALKENLPGPMSDGDRDFLLSIPPNILTTREGNKALVFMMMKRAQFDQAMQQSLLRANPKTKAEFEAWENDFKLSHGEIFDAASKQDLLSALGASGT
ncbi:MAG: hypothetical protein AAFO74_13040 [Pseudomonadota bacterium]